MVKKLDCGKLNSFIESTGLSQRKFAEKTGLHFTQLNRYVKGAPIQNPAEIVDKIRSAFPEFMREEEENNQRTTQVDCNVVIAAKDEVINTLKTSISDLRGIIEDKVDIITFLKEDIKRLREDKIPETVAEQVAHDYRKGMKIVASQMKTIMNQITSLQEKVQLKA